MKEIRPWWTEAECERWLAAAVIARKVERMRLVNEGPPTTAGARPARRLTCAQRRDLAAILEALAIYLKRDAEAVAQLVWREQAEGRMSVSVTLDGVPETVVGIGPGRADQDRTRALTREETHEHGENDRLGGR